jgi:hypothetical protein
MDKLPDLIGERHVIYPAEASEKTERAGPTFETSL